MGSVIDGLLQRNDTRSVARLAERWRALIATMQRVGMAHGNLTGSTVMVRTGDESLVLVNYDTVFVPGMKIQTPTPPSHAAYQHRDQQNRPFDADMDHFAALLIYTALRALALQPDLWPTYSTRTTAGRLISDTLLFSSADLAQPSNSPLFAALRRIPNTELLRLVNVLETACESAVSAVPDFGEVVAAVAVAAHIVPPPPAASAAETAFAQLRQALLLMNDQEAADRATTPLLRAYPPAQTADVVAKVAAARARLAIDRKIRAALANKDIEAAFALWYADGFHATPLGRKYRDRDDLQGQLGQEEKLQHLQQALDHGDDWIVAQLWPGLENYTRAQAWWPQVAQALKRAKHARLDLQTDLQTAIQAADEAAIVKAIGRLTSAAVPISAAEQARGEQAVARLSQRTRLENLLKTGNVAAILDCWEDNNFPNTRLAEPFRALIWALGQRYNTRTTPRVLGPHPSEIDVWQRLKKLLDDVDDVYHEEAVLAEWERLGSGGSSALTLFQPRIEQIRARRKALAAVRAAVRNGDARALLRAWDGDLLTDYPPAQQYIKQHTQAAKTLCDLAVLEEALNLRDLSLILALWNGAQVGALPHGSTYEGRVREAKRVWLSDRVPRNLKGEVQVAPMQQGVIPVKQIQLTWYWPAGLAAVRVVVRLDSFADTTTAGAPGEFEWAWTITRTQYEHDNSLTVAINDLGNAVYVRLFPLVSHEGSWLTTRYGTPVILSLRVPAAPAH